MNKAGNRIQKEVSLKYKSGKKSTQKVSCYASYTLPNAHPLLPRPNFQPPPLIPSPTSADTVSIHTQIKFIQIPSHLFLSAFQLLPPPPEYSPPPPPLTTGGSIFTLPLPAKHPSFHLTVKSVATPPASKVSPPPNPTPQAHLLKIATCNTNCALLASCFAAK